MKQLIFFAVIEEVAMFRQEVVLHSFKFLTLNRIINNESLLHTTEIMSNGRTYYCIFNASNYKIKTERRWVVDLDIVLIHFRFHSSIT